MTKPPTGNAVATELEFHPVCLMFPNMNSWEFNALVNDILHNGVREPIWLDKDGKVIDGRHRVKACIKLQIDVPYRVIEDGEDPVFLAISANLARRHLGVGQRAMIAARIANMLEGRPKTAQKFAVNPGIDNAGVTTEKEKITQNEAANLLNISRRSVQNAKALHSYGTPELARMVEDGKVHLTAASEVARLSFEKQAEIVAKGPKAVEEAAAHHRRMVQAQSHDVVIEQRADEPFEVTQARREERFLKANFRPKIIPSRSPAPTAPQPSRTAPGTALRIPLGYGFIDVAPDKPARLLPWSIAESGDAVKRTAKGRDISKFKIIRLYGEPA